MTIKYRTDAHQIFFVSDTHFGHRAMAEHWRKGKYPWYSPTLAEQMDPAWHPLELKDFMDRHMIELWNATVPPHGIVYHLGDVSFRNATETASILTRLNGEIHLVPGNHDKKHINVVENYGWIIEPPLLNIDVDDQRVVLCHYALRSWDRMHFGAWQCHGHSHGNLEHAGGKQLDVGVDCVLVSPELRPLSFGEVSRYMAGETFVAVDHHTVKE